MHLFFLVALLSILNGSKTLPDQRTDKNECLKRTKKAGKKMETLRTPIQNPEKCRIQANVKTYLEKSGCFGNDAVSI